MGTLTNITSDHAPAYFYGKREGEFGKLDAGPGWLPDVRCVFLFFAIARVLVRASFVVGWLLSQSVVMERYSLFDPTVGLAGETVECGDEQY